MMEIPINEDTLELGSGNNPIPVKHTCMDIVDPPNTWEGTFIPQDLSTFPWNTDDNKYGDIIGLYIAEHIPWREINKFFSECHRVLKPKGKIYLTTSNLVKQCKKILQQGVNLSTIETLFGSQEYPHHAGCHKVGFSPEFITNLLENNGFFDIEVYSPMPDIVANVGTPKIGGLPPLGLYPACDTDMLIIATKGIPIVGQKGEDMKIEVSNKENKPISPTEAQNPVEKKKSPETPSKPPSSRGLALNLGSFTVLIPDDEQYEWINIDKIDITQNGQNTLPDNHHFLCHDLTKNIPKEDKTVDFINMSHLIEHLYVPEAEKLLTECMRVLKTAGKIRIGTPDLGKLIQSYLNHNMDRYNEHQPQEYIDAPSQADKFWRILTSGHYTVYDTKALSEILKKTGFLNIHKCDYDKKTDMFPDLSLYMEATKQEPSSQQGEVKDIDFVWSPK